jgi:hypothetical protein
MEVIKSMKNKFNRQGTVAHTCNPSYLEGGDGRMAVWGHTRQKSLQDTISKDKLSVGYTPVIPNSWET